MSSVVLVVSTGKAVAWEVAFPGKTTRLAREGGKRFGLMRSIKTLQMNWKSVKIAFDEEGTSLGVKGEDFFEKTYPRIMRGSPNYFQVAGRQKEKMLDEVRKGLKSTQWWDRYKAKVKSAITTARQDYEHVYVVCLPGGPITDVERAEMHRIVKEAKSDNKKQDIRRLGKVHEVSCSNWDDFLQKVYEVLEENCEAPFSSEIVKENARQTYREIVRAYGKCDLDALETFFPEDVAEDVLLDYDEDGKGELDEDGYVNHMLVIRRRIKREQEWQRRYEESSDSGSGSSDSD